MHGSVLQLEKIGSHTGIKKSACDADFLYVYLPLVLPVLEPLMVAGGAVTHLGEGPADGCVLQEQGDLDDGDDGDQSEYADLDE
jgi:hypothetical protein